ncbi:hypothetical protein C0J52_09998 [Blattella germanica]|nr:hypothetical protein C0J52_09998 [Blattella germanica]
MKCFILLAVLFLGCTIATDEKNEYTKFYESLEEELKIPFLQYQLTEGVLRDDDLEKIKISPIDKNIKSADGLGISEDIFAKVENLDPPEGFTDNLYEMTKEKFGLNKREILGLALRRDICINGVCHGLGDVGGQCC